MSNCARESILYVFDVVLNEGRFSRDFKESEFIHDWAIFEI